MILKKKVFFLFYLCLSFSLFGCALFTNLSEDAKKEEENTGLKRFTTFKNLELTFEFPSKKWSLLGIQKSDKSISYLYTRQGITDRSGNMISPSIGVIFEKVEKNTTSISYSMKFYEQSFYVVRDIRQISDKIIGLEKAIGYTGKYRDVNHIEHTVAGVYSVSGRTGMQIVMDVTTEIYPKIEKELNYIFKTLKYTDKK